MYKPRQLAVNGKRLMQTLHDTCAWGAAHRYGPGPAETGMCRLTLTDDDKTVRDWFAGEMGALGMDVKVDQIGNMFAVRAGRRAGAPTAMGSHLDTQPTGGRYDGILGVMAAVEAVRTMHDAGVETQYPVAVVNWTNEEGARFPKSLHGSSVWAGNFPLAQAYALEDVAAPGVTAGAELERIGYKGALEASAMANPLAAHFELHIEQGPVLPANGQRIGVVTGGQAYKWWTVTISGRDSHAGTTPLAYRADPLLAAAKVMVAARAAAARHGGLATTGILQLAPGSINTIPHTVAFSLDVRHVEDAGVAAIEADVRAAAAAIAAAEDLAAGGGEINRCSVEWTPLFDAPRVAFHDACRAAIRDAAYAALPPAQVADIVSGAGHDSCATAAHCPTGMVFVPCRDGLSHNPREFASDADCALGAQVLLDAVMLYDQRRKV